MPLLMKLGGELKKWVTGEHETSLAVCFLFGGFEDKKLIH